MDTYRRSDIHGGFTFNGRERILSRENCVVNEIVFTVEACAALRA